MRLRQAVMASVSPAFRPWGSMAGPPGLGHRCANGGTLGRSLERLVGGIAAIDQPSVGVLCAARASLLKQGCETTVAKKKGVTVARNPLI